MMTLFREKKVQCESGSETIEDSWPNKLICDTALGNVTKV